MTVLDVLQSTTAYFKKRSIEAPRLNAEHLLAHVLGRTRIELYLEFERELGETALAPLRELVRRRGEGQPLQHLLGTVEFCGLTFLCDKRALVPRPETEQLVEIVHSKIGPSSPRRVCDRTGIRKSKIIDVGTGSGVIALCLAKRFPEAQIDAVDVSEDALALARENAARLGLGGRVQFRKNDLLENFDERFDLIIANLPYIDMEERQSLSREVLHDPEAALFAGHSGQELIRRLIEQAPSRLHPSGLLALEIGIAQAGALSKFLAQNNWRDIESKNDYSGVTRYLFARYG